MKVLVTALLAHHHLHYQRYRPLTKKNKSHPRQTTAANQSYMHTEEHRFTQSEIDDDN
jgi:hypothetical protein